VRVGPYQPPASGVGVVDPLLDPRREIASGGRRGIATEDPHGDLAVIGQAPAGDPVAIAHGDEAPRRAPADALTEHPRVSAADRAPGGGGDGHGIRHDATPL